MTLRLSDVTVVIDPAEETPPPRVRYALTGTLRVLGQPWEMQERSTNIGNEKIVAADDDWSIAAVYDGLPDDPCNTSVDGPSPTAKAIAKIPDMLETLINLVHTYHDDDAWTDKADAHDWLKDRIEGIQSLLNNIIPDQTSSQ